MKLLDCTLRDGGYVNNWNFTEKFTNEFFDVINCNKIDFIEVGFINNNNVYKKELTGRIRYLNNSKLQEIKEKNNYSKIAVMGDYGNINIDLLKENIDVDMIRIAFHKKAYKEALKYIHDIKKMGYIVSANAMGVTNYDENELADMLKYVKEYELDYIYIADSYGSLNQNTLSNYINKFNSIIDKNKTKLGLHLHNNMNNAFSNFEYVYNNLFNKVDIVDTTLFGMGRGAGNLQTELALIKRDKIFNKNILNLLLFINTEIKNIYTNTYTRWGYDIDYLLSGLFCIHPNYVDAMRQQGLENTEIIYKLFELSKSSPSIKSYFKIENII